MKRLIYLSLLVLILAGCQGGAVTSTPTAPLTPSATPTAELAPPPTAIIAPTLPPGPTATPDTRLPPERWQEWPIVPAATGRAMELYRLGLSLGNNPRAFSKIGDCQNVKAAFMGFFDIPERYNLGPDYQYLQETIDNFSGYFNTDGEAVKGGFNAATVLSPLWANPEVCLAGENPLECELRVTKPSIAFISFEVWWEGRTAEDYEKYMRQIIETVMAHGTVPILATKADNVEGDHSLNLTTARLAHEYDLPLWNFWLAVQPLAYHGLDPERNDGFHISTDGWNVRSFTGLQALDSVWQGVRNVSLSVLPTPTATPQESGTSGLLATPSSGPSLAASSQRLVFGLARREGGGYQPRGVYLFDLDTLKTTQLLGPGWDYQDASPDGRSILVNHGAELFRTDGSSLTLLTDRFHAFGSNGALFLPDGRIAVILQQEGGIALAVMQADGSGTTLLSQSGLAPIDLYPSTDGLRLTWESGVCSAYNTCERQGAWLTDLLTGQSRSLTGIQHPLVAPDGVAMAYEFVPEEDRLNLAFASPDGVPVRNFPLYGDILSGFAWQPQGDWLMAHLAVRSDYSGKVTDGANYLVNATTYEIRQMPSALLLNPRLVWSPDGESLAWLGTDWQEDQYAIKLFEVEAASGQATNLSSSLGVGEAGYIFVTNGDWLTAP
jgi:hypothetical protein